MFDDEISDNLSDLLCINDVLEELDIGDNKLGMLHVFIKCLSLCEYACIFKAIDVYM
jgi:hypothetical protein